jgi:hypothetical protein
MKIKSVIGMAIVSLLFGNIGATKVYAGTEVVDKQGDGAGDHWVRFRCDDGYEFSITENFTETPSNLPTASSCHPVSIPNAPAAAAHDYWKGVRYSDQVVHKHVNILPIIRKLGPIESRTQEQIANSNKELLNACRRSVQEITRSKDGRKLISDQLDSKFKQTVSNFDKGRAVKLRSSLSTLPQENSPQTSEILCAMDQLADVVSMYNDSSCRDQQSCKFKEIAKEGLNISIDDLNAATEILKKGSLSFDEKMESHQSARNIAYELLKVSADIGTSFLPGVSTARDIYEAVSGYDLMTGEELDDMGRAIAAMGVVSLGVGKVPFKALEKVAKGVNKAGKIQVAEKGLTKAIYKAEKLGESATRNAAKWGHWGDLEKITHNGREYAAVDNRLFTQHAVEHMAPRALGSAPGRNAVLGRGVPPSVVESVITNGQLVSETVSASGATRQVWLSDGVQVVTEQAGRIIVTVMRVGS